MSRERFMRRCLELANSAYENGDIPVGAVVVLDGEIVGEGFNQREKGADATAHAEILAIREACQKLNRWRLEDCEIFISLEPCAMCAGAILNSRIKTIHFGAKEPKTGCCSSVLNLFSENLGHKPRIYGGELEEECAEILQNFFKKIRK